MIIADGPTGRGNDRPVVIGSPVAQASRNERLWRGPGQHPVMPSEGIESLLKDELGGAGGPLLSAFDRLEPLEVPANVDQNAGEFRTDSLEGSREIKPIYYDKVLDAIEPDDRRLVGTFVFAQPEDFPPLQVADLWAYELSRDQRLVDRTRRYPMRRLIEARKPMRLFRDVGGMPL